MDNLLRQYAHQGHKFRELEAKMSPEALAVSDATHCRLKESTVIEELRDAPGIQFESLAADE
jgi:hypothetical protein